MLLHISELAKAIFNNTDGQSFDQDEGLSEFS